MTLQKAIIFVNKLIEDTKEGTIRWSRHTAYKPAPDKSFCASLNGGTIYLIPQEKNPVFTHPNPYIRVSYESDMPVVEIDFDDSDFVAKTTRLYNLVYEQFMNIDKFVDQYLAP